MNNIGLRVSGQTIASIKKCEKKRPASEHPGPYRELATLPKPLASVISSELLPKDLLLFTILFLAL